MPSSATLPPAVEAPVIPEGLATKMGKWGTLLLFLVTLIQPLLVDGKTETGNVKFFAILTTIVGGITIAGRMLQSAAALFGSARPSTTVINSPGSTVANDTSGAEDDKAIDEDSTLYPIEAREDDDVDDDVDDSVPQARQAHNGPGTDLHDAQGA